MKKYRVQCTTVLIKTWSRYQYIKQDMKCSYTVYAVEVTTFLQAPRKLPVLYTPCKITDNVAK